MLGFVSELGKSNQEVFTKQLNLQHLANLRSTSASENEAMSTEDVTRPLNEKGKQLHKEFTEIMDDPVAPLLLLHSNQKAESKVETDEPERPERNRRTSRVFIEEPRRFAKDDGGSNERKQPQNKKIKETLSHLSLVPPNRLTILF